MRIIAGRFKGHRILSPSGKKVRPTADRVREAIFSHVGEAVVGAGVLELFAGTGAFGFEALSRGAGSVVLVEKDPATAQFPRRMLDRLDVKAGVSVLVMDALAAVRVLARTGERFGIIFLDPPYESDWLAKLMVCPGLWDLLEPDGLMIVERQTGGKDLPLYEGIEKRLSRSYGGTLVEVYRNTIPE